MLFLCGDRLYTSESDVYRRQILTYRDRPRAERVKKVYSRYLRVKVTNRYKSFDIYIPDKKKTKPEL